MSNIISQDTINDLQSRINEFKTFKEKIPNPPFQKIPDVPKKDELYEGSQIRYIYWVEKYQK
jgi:hypothetical protein